MPTEGWIRARLVGGKHDGAVKDIKDPGVTYSLEGHVYRRDRELDQDHVRGYRWEPQNPGVRPQTPP